LSPFLSLPYQALAYREWVSPPFDVIPFLLIHWVWPPTLPPPLPKQILFRTTPEYSFLLEITKPETCFVLSVPFSPTSFHLASIRPGSHDFQDGTPPGQAVLEPPPHRHSPSHFGRSLPPHEVLIPSLSIATCTTSDEDIKLFFCNLDAALFSWPLRARPYVSAYSVGERE